MQVIGAGLGRTGTKSLQAALNILGYKTYHFPSPAHAAQFAAMAEGHATAQATLEMVVEEGFTACCDQPMADLYTEQMILYPEAKVVLTIRDTSSKWEASWQVLMAFIATQERPFSWSHPSFIQWIPFMRHWKTMRGMMGTHLGLPRGQLVRGWVEQPEGWLAKQYEKHNAQVVATVPKARLLVFNVKQGWAPLCAFLGKPVPEQPFPFVNETADLERATKIMNFVTHAWIPVVVASAAGLWGLLKYIS